MDKNQKGLDKQPNKKFCFGKLRLLFPPDIMKAVVSADYTRSLRQRERQIAAARKINRREASAA